MDSGVQTAAGGPRRLVELLRMSAHTEGSGPEVATRRSKRSVFLHSGVRICPQETISEVLANHQAYYQLRGTSHRLLHTEAVMCHRFRAQPPSCYSQGAMFLRLVQEKPASLLLNRDFPINAFRSDWFHRTGSVSSDRLDWFQLEFVFVDTHGRSCKMFVTEGHPDIREAAEGYGGETNSPAVVVVCVELLLLFVF